MDEAPKVPKADERLDPLGALPVRIQAKLLGVSPSTVVRDRQRQDSDGYASVWKVQGTDGKFRPSRRLDTSSRDALIVRRRAAGDSVRAIAQAADCSVGTVHRVMKKAGG